MEPHVLSSGFVEPNFAASYVLDACAYFDHIHQLHGQSTLPIFRTTSIKRFASASQNFLNSGASR